MKIIKETKAVTKLKAEDMIPAADCSELSLEVNKIIIRFTAKAGKKIAAIEVKVELPGS